MRTKFLLPALPVLLCLDALLSKAFFFVPTKNTVINFTEPFFARTTEVAKLPVNSSSFIWVIIFSEQKNTRIQRFISPLTASLQYTSKKAAEVSIFPVNILSFIKIEKRIAKQKTDSSSGMTTQNQNEKNCA
jgi:hypothetical protein